MIDFIKNLDFMGREFKFNIGGGMGDTYKTTFGGLLSLFQAIGFLVLLWYFGQDIYLRESPSMIVSSSLIDKFPMYDIDSTTFNFGFRVEDVLGNFLDDPREFTYDLIYRKFEVTESGGFEVTKQWNKDLEKCSTKHFDNFTLYNERLYNYFCIENNYTIGGDWGASEIQVPTFLIRRCSIETELKYNIKCKTDDEIKHDHSNLFYVDLYLQKNLINPHNFSDPIKSSYSYGYKQIDIFNSDVLKQEIYYSTGELITDTGFLFSDISTSTFLEYESQTSNEGTLNPALGPYLSSAEFFITRGKRSYTRTYIRISDALANVGGLMSLFTVVIEIMFSFYLQNSYNKFIQEKFLKLNHEVKEDKNQNNNQIEMNVLKGDFSNSNDNKTFHQEEDMKNIENKHGQKKK